MESRDEFYKKIWRALKDLKKEACIVLMAFAFFVEIIPSEIHTLEPSVARSAQISAIIIVAFFCLDVLFEILFRTKEVNKIIVTIDPSKILDYIFRLVANEENINIKYISIAGQTGWGNVLSKFLDKNDKHSLLRKRHLKIEIALIDENVLDILENCRTRYSSVSNSVEEINKTKERLANQGYDNVSITLMRYNYMPNTIGFLVNDNYLFSAPPYWEEEDGSKDTFVMRGGRREHIVYDRNDGFGGDFYIQKFIGWFKYIKSKA